MKTFLRRLIHLFDQRLNLITLLLIFWAIFWSLNGFDKFFDGQPEIIFEGFASKGAVVDDKNQVVYTIQSTSPVGWFGVNYEDQIVSYFKTLHVPRSMALFFLYAFAVCEIIIGLIFAVLIVWQLLPERREDKKNMFTDRTLHRLAYKASIMMFVVLSVSFILFGDRTRLWEVGTYFAMTLITYDMWYRTDRFLLEMRRKRIAGEDDDDPTNSDQASAYGNPVVKEDVDKS